MLSLQDYRFEWLAVEQFPLVGKFYQHHGIRGNVGRSDLCAVLRQADNTIVAIAILKQRQQFQLLNHVAVVASLRRKGLASLLLSQMSEQFNIHTYCFPFSHLEPLYLAQGFVSIKESLAIDDVVKQYRIYLKQGRDIQLMRYQLSDGTI